MNNSPFKFKNYDLTDLELYCSCGHMINFHSNGLGGGISICEYEDGFCGCTYAEYDYELTVAMNFFQGKYDNFLISKLTPDTKRRWTMTWNYSHFPSYKEPYQMVVC